MIGSKLGLVVGTGRERDAHVAARCVERVYRRWRGIDRCWISRNKRGLSPCCRIIVVFLRGKGGMRADQDCETNQRQSLHLILQFGGPVRPSRGSIRLGILTNGRSSVPFTQSARAVQHLLTGTAHVGLRRADVAASSNRTAADLRAPPRMRRHLVRSRKLRAQSRDVRISSEAIFRSGRPVGSAWSSA
jgi:hypothetical protein